MSWVRESTIGQCELVLSTWWHGISTLVQPGISRSLEKKKFWPETTRNRDDWLTSPINDLELDSFQACIVSALFTLSAPELPAHVIKPELAPTIACPTRAPTGSKIPPPLARATKSESPPLLLQPGSTNSTSTRQRPIELPIMSLVSGEKSNFQFVSLPLHCPNRRQSAIAVLSRVARGWN